MPLLYDTLRSDADLAAIAEILSWGFGLPHVDSEAWTQRLERDDLRVLRDEGRVVACALHIPMGQFFGGAAVPLTGVAAVGTAPDRRGKGVGAALMQGLVRELHEARVPLSGLYPALRTLYRQVGYAPAGSRFELRVRASDIDVDDRTLELRPMHVEDEVAVREAYRAQASLSNGPLDRGEYIWRRVKHPRNHDPARGFVVLNGDRVEGYVYAVEARGQNLHYDLRLTDVVVRSAAAARRVLTFCSDHRSLGDDVVWFGGPSDPLAYALPESGFSMKLDSQWMIRVTHVEAALAARGYPEGLRAELHMDVTDALLPGNHGRFVLEIADGRGTVTRGGRGAIALDVRALASMYTAHMAPHMLAAAGLVSGPRDQLAAAALAFSGPVPWTADMY